MFDAEGGEPLKAFEYGTIRRGTEPDAYTMHRLAVAANNPQDMRKHGLLYVRLILIWPSGRLDDYLNYKGQQKTEFFHDGYCAQITENSHSIHARGSLMIEGFNRRKEDPGRSQRGPRQFGHQLFVSQHMGRQNPPLVVRTDFFQASLEDPMSLDLTRYDSPCTIIHH